MIKYMGLIFLATCLILTSCANLPSVCDTMTQKSYLCDISQKHGVRLEDVGNGLIVVNAIAIQQGLYTKEQAIKVLSEIDALLKYPISYAAFKAGVYEKVDAFPGLIEVASIYFSELGLLSQDILQADRKLLVDWIAKQLSFL